MHFDDYNISALIDHALNRMQTEYGTGCSDGKTPLAYHNRVHAEEVMADCELIASLSVKNQIITPRQATLCVVAAAFHDVVQGTGAESDTQLSVNFFLATSSKFPSLFSEQEELIVSNAILSTTFLNEGSKPTQKIRHECSICNIVADADLAGIAQPSATYWERAKRFERELFGENPSIENQIKMLHLSEVLLSNHQFFTAEAATLFPFQEQNLAEVQQQIAKLQC